MNTLQTILTQGRVELDKNQRLFLHGKLHSTQFNRWFEQHQQDILAGVRGEIEKLLIKYKKYGNYDGNDLSSACDYHHFAAKDWTEIIRFENGAGSALDDLLAALSMGDKKE